MIRKIIQIDEKKEVAKLAAKSIEDNETLFLGPGTTIELLAHELTNRKVRVSLEKNEIHILREAFEAVENSQARFSLKRCIFEKIAPPERSQNNLLRDFSQGLLLFVCCLTVVGTQSFPNYFYAHRNCLSVC